MRRISRIVGWQTFAQKTAGAVSLDQGVMGSIAAVGCFAVIGLFSAPFSVVLGKVFLLSLAMACIAGVAIVARWHGVVSLDSEAQAKRRITT